jgi:hypothetical protein
MTIKRALLACLFIGLYALPVYVADYIAETCSPTDVQAAINLAAPGDKVIVPGSCTWTSGVLINGKAITLAGAPEGSRITDGVPDGTYLVAIGESTTGHIEVTGLTFDSRGTTHGSGSPTFHIGIFGTVNGRAVLLHDNMHLFSTGGGVNAYYTNVNRGVVYRNVIAADFPPAPWYRNTFSAIRCKNSANQAGIFGTLGWEGPSTLGTLDATGEQNLYFEDNTVRMLHEGTDFDDACRIVFRNNILDNTSVQSHGYDSSPLGSRQVEVYGNTFLFGETDSLGIQVNIGQLIHLRGGGVWVIHNNIIPDANTGSNWGNPAEMNIQLYGIRSNICYNGTYPMPRQHGQGHTGSAYVFDPVYIWNNRQPNGTPTPNPAVSDIGDGCGNNRSTSEFVQLNRDYFLTARPGYAPYPYPHPLRGSAPAPTPTPTPEPLPEPTPAPAPPPETCAPDGTGNGVDEDQDGQVDEICMPAPPPPPADTTAPFISSFVIGRRTGNNFPVTLHTSDESGIDHVEFWVGSVMQVRLVAPTSGLTMYASKVQIKTLGIYTVTAKAFDIYGNMSSQSASVVRR